MANKRSGNAGMGEGSGGASRNASDAAVEGAQRGGATIGRVDSDRPQIALRGCEGRGLKAFVRRLIHAWKISKAVSHYNYVFIAVPLERFGELAVNEAEIIPMRREAIPIIMEIAQAVVVKARETMIAELDQEAEDGTLKLH